MYWGWGWRRALWPQIHYPLDILIWNYEPGRATMVKTYLFCYPVGGPRKRTSLVGQGHQGRRKWQRWSLFFLVARSLLGCGRERGNRHSLVGQPGPA